MLDLLKSYILISTIIVSTLIVSSAPVLAMDKPDMDKLVQQVKSKRTNDYAERSKQYLLDDGTPYLIHEAFDPNAQGWVHTGISYGETLLPEDNSSSNYASSTESSKNEQDD